jgi:hypothetical protein
VRNHPITLQPPGTLTYITTFDTYPNKELITPLKFLYISTEIDGFIFQKLAGMIFVVTALRTANLTAKTNPL